MLVLGCANENEEEDVGSGVVLPKALVRGAPKTDVACPVDLVEFVPKLNPVFVFATVEDVFVLCPKVKPLVEGFDCARVNALPVVVLSDPNEKGVLPLLFPKVANGEDCGCCMVDVIFFSTLRVGLSSIRSAASSIPSLLSTVDSDGFGVLGMARVPTFPKPPKAGLVGSAVVAFISLCAVPEPEENAFMLDVALNEKPDFFSAGGGVEGAAPKENGDFTTSVSDAFG